jgi:hypothetical protein
MMNSLPETAVKSAPAHAIFFSSSDTRVQRLDTLTAMQIVFSGAPADDLVAIGSVRPGRSKNDPYLRAEHPIPAGQLETMAPQLFAVDPDRRRYLQFVTYVPHACPAIRKGGSITYRGGTLWVEAKNGYVSNIYAFVLDLDLGRPGTLTADEGYRDIVRLVRDSDLPRPSLVAFSGRGLYLIYIMRDEQGVPLRNDEEIRNQRLMVIDDLLARVPHLHPDRRASRSLARWFKSPSSACYYKVDPGDGGDVTIWTPADLIDFCLQHPVKDPRATSFSVVEEVTDSDALALILQGPISKSKRRSNGKRSWKQNAAPSFVRKAELERLAQFRGMGENSGRHLLLFYYGAAVRDIEFCRTGDIQQAQTIATSAALQLNASFAVPLGSEAVHDAMFSKGTIKHTNTAVAGDLGVTDEEVESLRLSSTIPEGVARTRRDQKAKEIERKRNKQKLIDYFLASGLPVSYVASLAGCSCSTVSTRKKEMVGKAQRRGRAIVQLPRGRVFLNLN